MTRICIATGTRAEWGLLAPLARSLQDASFDVRILATGTHFEERFGSTSDEIVSDGFSIDEQVPLPLSDDSPAGVAEAMGVALSGAGAAFSRMRPDLTLVLGDRYETLAVAAASVLARVPVVHLHGGEITEGAVDELFRHAITKLASLHFTSTEEYRARVISMGENPEAVFAVGALGVDNALRVPRIDIGELAAHLGMRPGPHTLVVTFHPETTAPDGGSAGLDALLDALAIAVAEDGAEVVFTLPNADVGNAALRHAIESFASRYPHAVCVVASLGVARYLSTVAASGAVVGNSSSGVIEAAALGVPAVDIGERQRGRVRAASVVHSEPETQAILAAIRRVTEPAFRESVAHVENPYGDGHAAERMTRILLQCAPSLSVHKPFFDATRVVGGEAS